MTELAEAGTEITGELVPVPQGERDMVERNLSAVQALLAGDLTTDHAQQWGLNMLDLGRALRQAGEQIETAGMATAALGGVGVREIGRLSGWRHATVRRRLPDAPTLGGWATGTGVSRVVTQDGLNQARNDVLRQDEH